MLCKLKFKLLDWLLGDICRRSGDGDTCECYLSSNDGPYFKCVQNKVYRQAVRAWKLKDYYECWNVEES